VVKKANSVQTAEQQLKQQTNSALAAEKKFNKQANQKQTKAQVGYRKKLNGKSMEPFFTSTEPA
jgi:hypothetical protein